MLEKRQKVITELGKINQVKFFEPTAQELHYQKNHLVRRVQRQEAKVFISKIEQKRVKLKADLKKIDKYLLKLKEGKKAVKPVIKISGMPVMKQTRVHSRRRLSRVR